MDGMNAKLLRRLGLAAVIVGGPFSTATSQNMRDGQGHHASAGVVIRGRVLSETGVPLPTNPDVVILGSHWTYRIAVKHVVSGKVEGRELTATKDADGALLKDRDFVFYLTRKSDGSYDVQRLDRVK